MIRWNPSALEFWTRLHSQPVIELFLAQRKRFSHVRSNHVCYSLFTLNTMEIFIRFFPSHFLWMSRSVTFQDNPPQHHITSQSISTFYNIKTPDAWESPKALSMRVLKIKKRWVLKKSCPVVHIHPTTPFSSRLWWASKVSKYRMADPNRGYVKLTYQTSKRALPLLRYLQLINHVQHRQKIRKSSPANFTYPLLPYRKLKNNWKMHHKEKDYGPLCIKVETPMTDNDPITDK